MLTLDAMLDCPTVGITLTTEDPDFGPERFRRAEASLWRALRRDYPGLRYYGIIEWTTGRGERSGGRRRMHMHCLAKDVHLEAVKPTASLCPAETAAGLRGRIAEHWLRYTGSAFIVDCEPLRTPAGAIGYVGGHHLKPEQAPPPEYAVPGKRLKRIRHSIGRRAYFRETSIAELRDLARSQLADERLEWAVQRTILADVYGIGEPEADAELTSALVAALADMAVHPPEIQVDVDGAIDHDDELAEFFRRAVEEAHRLRDANPPRVVRVTEAPDGSATAIVRDLGETVEEKDARAALADYAVKKVRREHEMERTERLARAAA